MLPDVGTLLSVHEGLMDTSEQRAIESVTPVKRRRRSVEEKRRIVEETLRAGASVARVAQRHAINANQVFAWRKRYREGRLGKSSKLLPVTVSDIPESKSGHVGSVSGSSAVGTMEIKLLRGTLRIAGSVDVVALRAVLECLAG
jgi:transposase